ncbi:response regulator [Tautonia marina]|uniref:response regulator n=1 Tax=Tautonia marina TaxID=2653855 RepID=UPI001260AF84|nr:response regulator [Tautonia marina]
MSRMVKFLLVEDDEDHAELVKRNLRRARVANSVTHVPDGVEALAFLRREGNYPDAERPDVVLLDLKLPKLDGLEVLTAIRADDELRDLPVVILTTSDAEADRERAYEHHVNSYLVKPVDFEKFRQMVNDLSLYWGVWNVLPPRTDE